MKNTALMWVGVEKKPTPQDEGPAEGRDELRKLQTRIDQSVRTSICRRASLVSFQAPVTADNAIDSAISE